ncbi:MAG TPA: hypothetical protein VFQ53_14575 [Kofleriaceae bacterium]|nr:hypothetical protein [Kofleriaceae bacterium]
MLLVLISGSAFAGTWSDKINYRYSNQTSLKVTEPDGFKVIVTLGDGGEKVGTVPELFTLPDQDAFVKVTIVPSDGSAPWSKKIEVRARQQAELSVTFKADPAPKAEPAKKAARTYVGRFANKAGGCGRAWSRTIRVEFLISDDGSVVKQAQIDSSQNSDLELPGGKYDVRVYIWNDREWKFVLTSNHDIGKDGWTLGFGCPVGKSTPAIVGG